MTFYIPFHIPLIYRLDCLGSFTWIHLIYCHSTISYDLGDLILFILQVLDLMYI